MLRVFLAGSHSNRTPMGYPAYRRLFEQSLYFVEEIESADVVVLAWIKDFFEISGEFASARRLNPNLKLIVISEEPFWDTLWGGDFYKRNNQVVHEEQSFDYSALNHVTSLVFDYTSVPYFITTENHYFSRYSALFARNSELSPKDWLELWQRCQWRIAFLARQRLSDKYDVAFPDCSIKGLCRYRSLLTLSFEERADAWISGWGWSSNSQRQELDDWHLDKIKQLDQRVLLMSALENTHQHTYVTEKLFDAFAIGAIPVYYADKAHASLGLTHQCEASLINVFGLSVDQAFTQLNKFEPDLEFAETYAKTQQELAVLFSDPEVLTQERRRVVAEIVRELHSVCKAQNPLKNMRPQELTVKQLEQALWGGLATWAKRGLQAWVFDSDKPTSKRFRAAWALARFAFYEGDFNRSLYWGETILSFGAPWSERKETALLFIFSLREMGDASLARGWAERFLQGEGKDFDRLLSLSSLVYEDSARLHWMNQVFSEEGLAGLQKINANQPLSLSNIQAFVPSLQSPFMVSVILPVFNSETTLESAIRSVLNQSWQNLELILVDDASTDSSAEIARHWSSRDSRVKLMSLSVNRGAYVARNTGLVEALGNFIMVHDADDWSHPQKIERQVGELLRDEQLLAVYSYWVRSDSELRFRMNWRLNNSLLHFSHVSLVFRRSVFDLLGGWDEVRVSADNEFLDRLKKQFGETSVKLLDCKAPLTFALDNGSSLTRSKPTHVRTIFYGLRQVYRQCQRHWHQHAASLYLKPGTRPFPVPALLLGESQPLYLDYVLVADFSRPLSMEIKARFDKLERGCTMGLMHWPVLGSVETAFHQDYFDLLSRFRAEPIVQGQKVIGAQVLVEDVQLLKYPVDDYPEFDETKSVEVFGFDAVLDINILTLLERTAIKVFRSCFIGQPCP